MTPTVQGWGDLDFLHSAYLLAARDSDDPNTQNGAIIVNSYGSIVGSGANTLPRGVTLIDERISGDKKYGWMVHAEENAIAAAAAAGKATTGCTMYAPYAACDRCAGLIIQAGIIRVIADQRLLDRAPERWRESIERGNVKLDEAGVRRSYLNVKLNGVKNLFDGQIWCP